MIVATTCLVAWWLKERRSNPEGLTLPDRRIGLSGNRESAQCSHGGIRDLFLQTFYSPAQGRRLRLPPATASCSSAKHAKSSDLQEMQYILHPPEWTFASEIFALYESIEFAAPGKPPGGAEAPGKPPGGAAAPGKSPGGAISDTGLETTSNNFLFVLVVLLNILIDVSTCGCE